MNNLKISTRLIILVAVLVGVLYTLPNFFGESPAVQVSSAKACNAGGTGLRRSCALTCCTWAAMPIA